MEGISHEFCYLIVNDDRKVNVDRDDSEWDDNWSFAGVSKL
jgi:hypothetical protein